jgi:predicted phage terminase large subunit-like protein
MAVSDMPLPSMLEVEAEVAQLSPADFASVASRGRWRWAPHLKLLNEKLLALAEGRIKRLIVTMPPRHGKSELCSRYFPAWYLGKYPDNRVILCSYEASFAASWGGKSRDLLSEYGEDLFGVTVREDAQSREDWRIAGHDGGMVTAGVGGAITGRGANLLIIDDPVKNAEEAASKVYRDKTWDWWQSTAYTRLEPGGGVLVIQTRWHEDDLAGRLLKEEADPDDETTDEKWEILNLPALAEDDDAMGRKPGEALWPERWPAEKLERRKRRFGVYFWFALYQQRPMPPGGEIFKRANFRFYETDGQVYRLGDRAVRADDCRRIITVDVAASEKTSADYSAAQVWALTPTYDLVLLDMWRDQSQIPASVEAIIRLSRQWDVTESAVEKNNAGLAVVQLLRRRGVAVRALHASKDKVMRSHAAQLRFEAGMVWFPKGEPKWLAVLMEELEAFPKSAHDDTVDTLCWAGIMAQKMGGVVRGAGDDEWDAEQDNRLRESAKQEDEQEQIDRRRELRLANEEDIDWLV